MTELRLLLVGGGGGGANGHSGGGGSGGVTTTKVTVKQGDVFDVVVGEGGNGALDKDTGDINLIEGNSNGQPSKFGTHEALGGESVYPVAGKWGNVFNSNGGNGGSGGGAGGYQCVKGYAGSSGTKGADCGQSNQNGYDVGVGGTGQGDYSEELNIFKQNTFKAGAGGVNREEAEETWWGPGGGAGGVLLNDGGPNGDDGTYSVRPGRGGKGYGAGGGGGGAQATPGRRYAGGKGAKGLVYIEWD